MKINDIINENTSAGNVASVVNPKNKKAKPKMQKPTDNALDMKDVSLFGGKLIKR